MTTCQLCGREIEPGKPAIELVGGFFSKDDPDIFVEDSDVMMKGHVHRDEMVEMLRDLLARARRNAAPPAR